MTTQSTRHTQMQRATRFIGALVLCLMATPSVADNGGAPAGGAPAGGAAAAAAAPAASSIPGAPDAGMLSGGHGAPTPPSGSPGPAPSGLQGQLTAGLLFEELDGDYFVTTDIYNTLSFGPVSLGVWIPLRWRVVDNDPKNDGVFRDEDWDEFSDYARLLRFVELNLGGDTWRFRGRFGALDGESIGHGTIAAGYYNGIDRDHYQGGLAMSTAIKYGGFEFMLDNLLDPEIFGLRFHIRPASFFSKNVWLNKFIMGVSMVMDTQAPTAVRWTDADNDGTYGAELDSHNNYKLDGTDAVGIYGIDVEYELLRTKLIDLVPYADLNFLGGPETGVGFHLGFFFNIRLPTPFGPTLLTRMEYRAIGDGYAPRYIDSLYEVQRVIYAPDVVDAARNNAPLSKLGWLSQGNTGNNGWLGELFFDFAGFFRVGGTYEDYDGPDNAALTLTLLLPKLKIAQAGAYYTRRGFDSFGEAFDLDGALARAFVRFKAYGPLYLTASYSRTWQADPENPGNYVTDDSWNVGVSASFTY